MRTIATGLAQPTGLAFIGEDEFLVNQKANGQVRRIVGGVLQPAPVRARTSPTPVFAWKFEVAPAGLGFVEGSALGPQYHGVLFSGGARNFLEGGHIFKLRLTGNRRKLGVDDPRIEDRVADNVAKFEITESESLLWGTDFGLTTDILQGPNGNLYVLSNTRSALYEVYRLPPEERP